MAHNRLGGNAWEHGILFHWKNDDDERELVGEWRLIRKKHGFKGEVCLSVICVYVYTCHKKQCVRHRENDWDVAGGWVLRGSKVFLDPTERKQVITKENYSLYQICWIRKKNHSFNVLEQQKESKRTQFK